MRGKAMTKEKLVRLATEAEILKIADSVMAMTSELSDLLSSLRISQSAADLVTIQMRFVEGKARDVIARVSENARDKRSPALTCKEAELRKEELHHAVKEVEREVEEAWRRSTAGRDSWRASGPHDPCCGVHPLDIALKVARAAAREEVFAQWAREDAEKAEGPVRYPLPNTRMPPP
jgi:hypothetical protein